MKTVFAFNSAGGTGANDEGGGGAAAGGVCAFASTANIRAVHTNRKYRKEVAYRMASSGQDDGLDF
jgi:hypothetical protein